MNLTPYTYNSAKVSFAQKKQKSSENILHEKSKYSDPLLKWPIRGLAYTNELGAALSEVAPKFGTLLWVPALLYFGADIYDKYKNEETAYGPNAKRGTEQAVFQLLASVLLPTAAVKIGQKTASALGAMGKNGLSLQTREETINFLQEFISRRHLGEFSNNVPEFKTHFQKSLSIKRENLIKDKMFKNPIELLSNYIFDRRNPHVIAISAKDKVLTYADKHIDEMFKIYSDLMLNKKPAEFSNKMWNNFNKIKNKLAKDPDYAKTYLSDAAEQIIKKYQKSKINNAKLLKTIGGFVALGFAIKPIDIFVEKIIMKKYIEPGLDRLDNLQVINYKEKILK